jgi:hypothetical protein
MITCKVSKHFDYEHAIYSIKIYNDSQVIVSEMSYSIEFIREVAADYGFELPESIGDMGWNSNES